jgi:putative sigma-54 modulation protein
MRATVTFRHLDSSEALRKYAEEKTERLAKYLFEPAEVHWVLSVEKIRHIAGVTVMANGVTIKAEEQTQDMYSAIDAVLDKLEKQLKRHKEKVTGHKTPSSIRFGQPEGGAPTGARPRIVKKVNQFVKPMSVEEAAMQMDVAGNDFLVFTDSSTSNINVIYKTRDGDYGLIEATSK